LADVALFDWIVNIETFWVNHHATPGLGKVLTQENLGQSV
jgi:hypothetical protein